MTLTIKLDGNWSSFQLANSAPPLCVTDSAIAPSARMLGWSEAAHLRLEAARVAVFSSDRCMIIHCTQRVSFLEPVGTRRSLKNCESHIDASHSRQPLVKGERLVRYEVNAVMSWKLCPYKKGMRAWKHDLYKRSFAST